MIATTIAKRPDLAGKLDDFPDCWPGYMAHHSLSTLFYERLVPAFPDFCLVAVDRATPDRPVAKAYCIPVAWPDDPAHDLPADGHDAVIMQAASDRLAGRRGTVVAAVEITVQVAARGRGLSRMMLDAMRDNCKRLGFRSLVAPVRPTGSDRRPDLPMTAYARLTRPDGLPVDPWLRTHVRAGGQLLSVAPRSMTLSGSLPQWRAWTGLPFDRTGPVRVPDALVPVQCNVDNDHAVYVEPNVWVRHAL